MKPTSLYINYQGVLTDSWMMSKFIVFKDLRVSKVSSFQELLKFLRAENLKGFECLLGLEDFKGFDYLEE